MKGWTFTKVWQVDHKLVVAPTIEDAIALFKVYMEKSYSREPYEIKAIKTADYVADYDAIIKEDK